MKMISDRMDDSREPLVQFTTGHWWIGTPPNGWPFIMRQQYGNQLYRWSLWLRLPGNRELECHGVEL